MNKKQKKTIGIILLITLGIILILLIGNFKFPFVVAGTNYLSISKVEVIDSGQRMMILATGGSAEKLLVRFSDSQLNQKLASEGYSVEKGINVDININKWQYTYPITLTSNTFKTIGAQNLKPYIGSELSCDLSDCGSSEVPKLGTYIFAYASEMSPYPLKYYCTCIYYYPSDKIGQFLGDLKQLDYNIDFKIGSETKSMNNNNKVVSLANGDFRAEYVGNLGTEFQRSKPGYDVLYKNGAYQNLIPSSGYDYPGKYGSIGSPNSYIPQCIGNVDLSKCTWLSEGCTDEVNKVKGCLNQYNSDFFIGSINKNSEYIKNNQVESLFFSGNSLIVNSNIPTFQPVFKIFIDAEYIGLKELNGIPEITSCAPKVEIDGGDSEQVSLRVKNIGTEDGQFDYSISCQSNQVSFSGTGDYFFSGQEKIINLLFSGTNADQTKDLTGSCTHKITDRKSQKSDSCTSEYIVKYSQLICNPGELRCGVSNNKVIERCDNSGLNWEVYQDCGDEFCSFKDGIFSCGYSPIPSNKCENCDDYALNKLVGFFWKNKKCEPKILHTIITCSFSYIKIFLVPLVIIFATLFGFNLFQTSRPLRIKNKAIAFLLSLFLGVGLATLVFFLFWYGIIASIIYLIGITIYKLFVPRAFRGRLK